MSSRYDERNKKEKFIEKTRLRHQLERERARFVAKMNGEKPQLYFSFGFSDLDIFTGFGLTWDMWIKFPFKVPKQQCEKFKEKIQDAFEEVFLT